MFIIALTYIRPMADIETNLEAHRQFLDKYTNRT